MTIRDDVGEVVRPEKIVNLRCEVERFLAGIKDITVVIEAGRSSYTMVNLLNDIGVQVTIA